jgi:hypothetical protein
MSWLLFFVSGLAVYRVADVIADEEGPFGIFRKLRRKVPAKTNPGRGIRCPYCMGIWVAMLTTAWLWWIGSVPGELAVIYVFGLSGQAALWKGITE